MLAVEQLSGREASLEKDVQAWADYLMEQDVAEAATELKNAVKALAGASEYLDKVQRHLEHLHDHGHDHHITATHFE
jgi:hypothetical protein